VNNHYFTLEKSLNGIDFEFIAQIQGEGNSNQIKDYNYQDNDLSNEVIYYRLSQTDFDGSEKVFPMISVDCSQEQEISIVPNPFKSTITISGLPSDCLIEIYGARGEKIESIKHHDSNNLEMNLEYLSSGIYFVRIIEAGGEVHSFKIIKN
ncbi:MAG: T9SS type A sorting domain-containing protein, partial [Bacteroidales bacterium]|nr:T9SS type A sorting domain-containing protein [Bacteroidales bacterium]